MDFYFNYTGPMDEELGMVFGAAYAASAAVSVLIGLAFYVAGSFGKYTLAKRRGLHNPWLVWIPVAGNWIMGSFSDQYQYLVKGEIKNRRKLLLGFSIANTVLAVLVWVIAMVMMVKLALSGENLSDGQMAQIVMVPAISVLIAGAILCVTKLVEYVLLQMCMYDLYRSCDPGNAVLYLVLGILFVVLEPIFLVALRKRDDGLPPRRDIPQYC